MLAFQLKSERGDFNTEYPLGVRICFPTSEDVVYEKLGKFSEYYVTCIYADGVQQVCRYYTLEELNELAKKYTVIMEWLDLTLENTYASALPLWDYFSGNINSFYANLDFIGLEVNNDGYDWILD